MVVRCGADDSLCDVAKEPRGFLMWKKGCANLCFFFVKLFHSGVFMVGLVLMVIFMSIFYLLSLV